MTLIGMAEAGKRIGVSGASARRALQNAGISLIEITARAFAVDEDDLAQFIANRPRNYKGRGRPLGAKNKSKNTETQT